VRRSQREGKFDPQARRPPPPRWAPPFAPLFSTVRLLARSVGSVSQPLRRPLFCLYGARPCVLPAHAFCSPGEYPWSSGNWNAR
jgi:hypothetical protein